MNRVKNDTTEVRLLADLERMVGQSLQTLHDLQDVPLRFRDRQNDFANTDGHNDLADAIKRVRAVFDACEPQLMQLEQSLLELGSATAVRIDKVLRAGP